MDQLLLDKGYITFPLGQEYNEHVDNAKKLAPPSRDWELINNEPFRQILLHPGIKELIDSIYGEGKYHVTSYSSNTISRDRSSRWHTDYPYRGYRGYTHNDSDIPLSIQVNISLEDFSEQNGATQYIPGSHKFTKVPHIETCKISQFICRKGTVMAYVGNLWHSAGVNQTDEPRSALLINFAPLSVEPFVPRDGTLLANQIKPDDPDFVVVDGKVLFR